MRRIFFILLLVCSSLFFGQTKNEHSKEINWISSFEQAKKIASDESKPILVFFTGSDWCMPCKNLVGDFFSSDKFKKIAESDFVLYEANFPRKKSLVSVSQEKENNRLKYKYDIVSYPTIYILNAKGIEIDKIVGYNKLKGPNDHFLFIENILNKKATK